MQRVLVDTSVWIDFFNNLHTREVAQLDFLLRENKRVCICPTILQEILQGLEAAKFYDRVKDNFLTQEILICEPVHAAVKSAELYQLLRKKGVTIRKSNDCLIAYHALHFNAEVLQKDRDFKFIAQYTGLKISQP
jgi:predicted nucleic acid-binding protein